MSEEKKNGLGRIMGLLNPYTAEDFFKSMRIPSLGSMITYLAISGVFLFIGYFTNLYYKSGFEASTRCSMEASLESALISVVTLIITPLVASLILSIFGKSLTGRNLETEEIMALFGYPLCIVMLSGIFRAHVLTLIVHYIGMGYGLYLLYVAVGARMGFDKSFTVLMFFILVFSVVLMVVSWMGFFFVNLIAGIVSFILDVPSSESFIKKIPVWCR